MAVRLETIEDDMVIFSKTFPTFEDAVEYCDENNLDRPKFTVKRQ